jgi:ubiquinone/menaquinone biosynthesis C-methylase UbiE
MASGAGRAESESWMWDRYWQFDRIASCFDSAGATNYDENVAAGWREFFGRLPQGTRILDLCSGNGAVAIIAAETGLARGKHFEIVAVDRADIDPGAHVSRHRQALAAIDFRGGTAAEKLPFGDDSFGAIVSQYGLEYTELDRALTELGRVAAPGARVRLVLHAAEGTVRADSERIVAEADFLLDSIDLPGTARRCFEAVIAAERSPNADEATHRIARECLAEFESALARTGERIAGAADPNMLRNCAMVLYDSFKRHGRFELDQLVAKTEAVRAEIAAHRGRLQALIRAAVSRDRLAGIAERLTEIGATEVEQADLRSGERLIGYVLEARIRA